MASTPTAAGAARSGSTGTVVATDPPGDTPRTVVSNLTTSLPASDTDGLGRTTSYLYDSYGRLTRVTQPETNYVTSATTPSAARPRRAWPAAGRPRPWCNIPTTTPTA
jgi:YD repeat-containing protein